MDVVELSDFGRRRQPRQYGNRDFSLFCRHTQCAPCPNISVVETHRRTCFLSPCGLGPHLRSFWYVIYFLFSFFMLPGLGTVCGNHACRAPAPLPVTSICLHPRARSPTSICPRLLASPCPSICGAHLSAHRHSCEPRYGSVCISNIPCTNLIKFRLSLHDLLDATAVATAMT